MGEGECTMELLCPYEDTKREGIITRYIDKKGLEIAKFSEGEIGGDYEFFGRPEWDRLTSAYELAFTDTVGMDGTLMYAKLGSPAAGGPLVYDVVPGRSSAKSCDG